MQLAVGLGAARRHIDGFHGRVRTRAFGIMAVLAMGCHGGFPEGPREEVDDGAGVGVSTDGAPDGTTGRGSTGEPDVPDESTAQETEAEPEPERHTFTPASFNIRYSSLDAGDPEKDWSVRRSMAARSIISAGAHIVGLQEVSLAGDLAGSQAAELVAAINDELGSNTWTQVGGSRQNAIAWDDTRIERLTDPETVTINVKHTRPNGAQRSMVWAIFRDRVSAREFIFASSHFQNLGGEGEPELMQQESAEIVSDTLDAARSEVGGLPAFVAADFNSWREDDGTPRGYLASRGYLSTRALASTVRNEMFDSLNSFDPMMTNRLQSRWIDGVLVAGDAEALAVGVQLDFADGVGLPLRTPLPSDHNLVWAIVDIGGEADE